MKANASGYVRDALSYPNLGDENGPVLTTALHCRAIGTHTEIAINRIRFCYDVLLNFAEHGAASTNDMDAVLAAEQLADALDHLLGRPRGEHDFAYLRVAEYID